MNNISILISIVSGVFAIMLALSSAIAAYLIGTNRIRMESRAKNRKAWMNTVIERLVDLLTNIQHEPDDKKFLTKLEIELELLLNPTQEDNQVSDIKRSLVKAIKDAVKKGFLDANQKNKIIDDAKKMLAYEWKMVKKLK